jgi:hypothetical protein
MLKLSFDNTQDTHFDIIITRINELECYVLEERLEDNGYSETIEWMFDSDEYPIVIPTLEENERIGKIKNLYINETI